MSFTYSFVVEDLTAPELDEILWLTPRKCRLKWNEVVNSGSTPGGSCFVKHLVGVEIISSNQIRVRGATPQTSWIGYACQIANSHPQNCLVRMITNAVADLPSYTGGPSPNSGVITLDTSTAGPLISNLSIAVSGVLDNGVDKNDSGIVVRRRTLKATISPYWLTARTGEEGAGTLPNSAERIQCTFCPLPTAASIPLAEELPSGEDPDQYVYLTWHQDISFGRLYTVTATGVEDISGNTCDETNTLDFTSPTFGAPANRVKLWANGVIPPTDRSSDMEAGGVLRKLSVIFQDLLNSLWYWTDQIEYIDEPDRCPEDWIPHLLYNRGNPFRFPMESMLLKRRLAAYLPSLYQKVGTAGGIEEFIYRLLGITVTLQPFITEPCWVLGDGIYGLLGLTTLLGAGTSYEKNCYKATISGLGRPLTALEERIIRDVCEWADPIWMHLVEIDDGYEDAAGVEVPEGQWILGVSYLGTETYLG